MAKTIGIVDEPNPRGNQDLLGISKHSYALTEFIKIAPTPLTIGIQGEWGSGKTSILNSIFFELEKLGTIKQIWINAWETSLLSTPEETLLKIINEILNSLIDADVQKSKVEKIRNLSSKIFKSALRIGANLALSENANQITEELLGQETNSIRQLRENLSSIAQEIMTRTTNPFKKIVVYVDDLDRIEPKDAVRILELVKNIFNVTGCIFLLAIDYQVVVKGLEAKFGKRSDDNEWEFRAFFDKIIQLPFMMPLGHYNIGGYVNHLLTQIGFNDDNPITEDNIDTIVTLSIGENPRSLKRLVNSLSLIMLFIEADADSEKQSILDDTSLKTVLLSLLCIQIAYPKIYDLLVKYPNYPEWDSKIAFEYTKLAEESDKERFSKDFAVATQTKEFTEEWQHVLYRTCYIHSRSKQRVTEISQLLTFLKNDVLQNTNQQVKDAISLVIGETTVTTVNVSSDVIATPKTDKRLKYGKPMMEYIMDVYNMIGDDDLIPRDQLRAMISLEVKRQTNTDVLPITLSGTLQQSTVNDPGRCHYNVNETNLDRYNFFYYVNEKNKKGDMKKYIKGREPAGLKVYYRHKTTKENCEIVF